MSFYSWRPYVSVAARRAKAEKAAAKARKAGAELSPVAASRGAIAKTFWGKAWCDNLERYSDYANRVPRGRTYVRNGSVIDLKIAQGEVKAQVMGSSLYKIVVGVAAVPVKQWQSISTACAGSIDSLVELLQGRLSRGVMERICIPDTGLFPAPKEIKFSCSCPDWAFMCKHVAAVLYGVGARLDEQPELIFTLRRVDARDLVTQAGAGLPISKRRPAAGRVLDEGLVADVFGIEMADVAAAAKPAAARLKSAAKTRSKVAGTPVTLAETTTKVAAGTTGKPPTAGKSKTTGKTAEAQEQVKAKAPRKTKVPRRSSARKSKTGRTGARATMVPKGTAATAGQVSGRSAKIKFR
jgi:uncharacterized Zn finger protein